MIRENQLLVTQAVDVKFVWCAEWKQNQQQHIGVRIVFNVLVGLWKTILNATHSRPHPGACTEGADSSGKWHHLTSSNENSFRVTGPLWGEFTDPGEFPEQRPVTRSFDVFFGLCLNNGWVNNREAGDLRRHGAHYDVIVLTSLGRWYFNSAIAPGKYFSLSR